MVAAMPSEVIYGSGGGVDVRVSWGTNQEGTVQVVSQATKTGEQGTDPFERLIMIVNQWLIEAGDADKVIDAAELKAALPYEPLFDGWWATLSDWAQVNRLIKALKRARDRQFGDPA
jgi:hypothetical protein